MPRNILNVNQIEQQTECRSTINKGKALTRVLNENKIEVPSAHASIDYEENLNDIPVRKNQLARRTTLKSKQRCPIVIDTQFLFNHQRYIY